MRVSWVHGVDGVLAASPVVLEHRQGAGHVHNHVTDRKRKCKFAGGPHAQVTWTI